MRESKGSSVPVPLSVAGPECGAGDSVNSHRTIVFNDGGIPEMPEAVLGGGDLPSSPEVTSKTV